MIDEWRPMCRRMKWHAESTAKLCAAPFAELIAEQVQKYCDLHVPVDADDLRLRETQDSALRQLISSISHADDMARSYPEDAVVVLAATEVFCEQATLDKRIFAAAIAFNSELSAICKQDG